MLVAVVALIIFNAVNSSSPVATTTTQPSTQTTIATTIPKTGKTPMTEKLLTEQGTMLYVPIAAVKSIDAAAGVSSVTQASSIIIVSHTVSPPSFTCEVTLISSAGSTLQKLIATVESAHGVWTASDA